MISPLTLRATYRKVGSSLLTLGVDARAPAWCTRERRGCRQAVAVAMSDYSYFQLSCTDVDNNYGATLLCKMNSIKRIITFFFPAPRATGTSTLTRQRDENIKTLKSYRFATLRDLNSLNVQDDGNPTGTRISRLLKNTFELHRNLLVGFEMYARAYIRVWHIAGPGSDDLVDRRTVNDEEEALAIDALQNAHGLALDLTPLLASLNARLDISNLLDAPEERSLSAPRPDMIRNVKDAVRL